MFEGRLFASLTLLAAGSFFSPYANGEGDSPSAGDTLVIHLVHPERQAAAVLNLFSGARVDHPAAAIARWKHAANGSLPLSKPLEAAITFMNPDMVREGIKDTHI